METPSAPLELSPAGQWEPAQGAAPSRLAVPLEEAVQQVLADPALADFQAWRAENPGWSLVGFNYHAGWLRRVEAAGAVTHEFRFAAPGGLEGYHMTSEYVRPDVPPVHSIQTRFAMRSGETDLRLPPPSGDLRPLTLGEADRLWRAFAGEEGRAQAPDSAIWGYGWLGDCPGPQGSVELCDAGWSPHWVLGHLSYGWEHGGKIVVPDVTPAPEPDPFGYAFNVIELNVTSARIKSAVTYQDAWDFQGWAQGVVAPGPPVATPPPTPTTSGFGVAVPASASAVALVLLIVYFAPALKYALTKAWCAIPGFTRLRDHDVLSQARRRAIVDCIQQDPGLNATEVHERVGGGWSTVIYHLGVLTKRGAITSLPDGRHRRFFPAAGAPQERDAIAALRNERTRGVHDAILKEPGIDRQGLAKRFSLSVPGVLWHVDRLTRSGLVESMPAGRRLVYRAKAWTKASAVQA